MPSRFPLKVSCRRVLGTEVARRPPAHAWPRLIWRGLAIGALCIGNQRIGAAPAIPAPLPPVPLIGTSYANDADGDAIEDQLLGRCAAVASQLALATPVQSAFARQQLEESVAVELIFQQPITSAELAAFQDLGGEIHHIYRAISYGWTGRLPLGRVPEIPLRFGAKLLLVEEAKLVQAHLDAATRTARVRPVWAPGFAGHPDGFAGNTNITIAIIDSGLDATHPDLAGRGVFWSDYTTDAAANPDDFSQHATHIASIALGSGVSSGAASATLSGTLMGSLSGFSSGNYVTMPFDFPTNPITFTATAIWSGGGTTTLQLMSHSKGTKTGWVTEGVSVTGTSPLTLNTPVTGLTNKVYAPVLVANGTISDYAIRFQIPQYPGGDEFNRMRGVAPECRWAAAKVFATNGNSLLTWTTAAIDDLVAERTSLNIKIINLSLGTTGSPGISTSTRQKVNTAVNNGIFVVCSGGNDGLLASANARQTDDPGRAALALTVAASSDINQLTDYSSQGFGNPGSAAGQEEDYKPDLMAPGGSSYYSAITAADSNSGDTVSFPDQQSNDYWTAQGTSFAAPFAAGTGALVIEALQHCGTNWDFNSAQHPLLVKMILCATATESNQGREGGLNNPTLQRASPGTNGYPAGKDQFEGYGMLNADAAVEAVAQPLQLGTNVSSLGPGATDRRAWARRVNLNAGQKLALNLEVPPGADYDLYLYNFAGGPFGQPVILSASTTLGPGVDESLNFEPVTNTAAFLVVKRIFGSGGFALVASVPPTAGFTATPTNGPAPLLVSFTNTSIGAQTYLWNFGDGGSSAAVQPAHEYTNSGIYSVTLVAANSAGTNSVTQTNLVIVAPGFDLVLTNAGFGGNDFQFTFPTTAGSSYVIEYKNALSDASWLPWQTNAGTGLPQTVIVPAATPPERYFRIRVE